MTSAYLQQWIQHPEMLNKDTLYELRTLLVRYPYFQSLRLLYLKNLYLLHDVTFGAELRKAVLYVADRRVLFYLIEGDRYRLKSQKSPLLSSKVPEEEPNVDRTLSLIDAFLATVPEEHSQVTELDYAMDYTTYLLQDDGQNDSEPTGGKEVPKLRGHELIDGFKLTDKRFAICSPKRVHIKSKLAKLIFGKSTDIIPSFRLQIRNLAGESIDSCQVTPFVCDNGILIRRFDISGLFLFLIVET